MCSVVICSSAELLAHKDTDGLTRLPPYEELAFKGNASLRINSSGNFYIVAFSTNQVNLIGNESFELKDKALEAKRASILKGLEDPNYLFNANDFGCEKVMPASVSNKNRLRNLNPEMSFKYVKMSDRAKHTDMFAHIGSQYKLKCKKPIVAEQLEFKILGVMPELEKLQIELPDNSGSQKWLLSKVKTKKSEGKK